MREKVYSLLRSVPRGKVTTYKDLAEASGTHQRAVAIFMKTNKDPRNIPCYKVVMSDGSLGGYSSPLGVSEKRRLLEKDGIIIENGIINLEKYRFKINKTP
jgi:O-6-methylguanine DNA methyltransferase